MSGRNRKEVFENEQPVRARVEDRVRSLRGLPYSWRSGSIGLSRGANNGIFFARLQNPLLDRTAKTRFADAWVITCKSAAEARAALTAATRILEQLGSAFD